MNPTVFVPIVFIAVLAYTVGTLVNNYVIPVFFPKPDLPQILAIAGMVSLGAFIATWFMLFLYVRAKVRR